MGLSNLDVLNNVPFLTQDQTVNIYPDSIYKYMQTVTTANYLLVNTFFSIQVMSFK